MLGEKNITKFLFKYKELFNTTIELEWCSLRRKNRHILIVNPGARLNNEHLYQIILTFTKECDKQNFFKRIEFIGLFPDKSCNL